MGQSTNAILWWGVTIPDSEYEAQERIGEIVHGDPDDESADLYGDGREWLQANGLFGRVEFVHHCSETAPMWGIALVGTVTTAARGWPKALGQTLDRAHDPTSAVHEAVEALGLDLAHSAYGWHMASYWEV